MIFVADIENTVVRFGFYKNHTLIHSGMLSSGASPKCADEYVMMLALFCEQKKISVSEITGAVLASVVPQLTEAIVAAVRAVFDCTPLIVAHGIKTGLSIRIDHHTQLGADIVANAVAAAGIFEKPFAVVDFKTATTISIVNANGEFCGGIIAPGVRLSADALSKSTAELPYISLDMPKSQIGKNTVDAMQIGCVLGAAAMVDGLLVHFQNLLGTNRLQMVATGYLASKVLPHCTQNIALAPNLTLDGLERLYNLNIGK